MQPRPTRSHTGSSWANRSAGGSEARLLGAAPLAPPHALLQGLAAVGTLLEITEHSNLEDGRILVNNIGRQRFKIVDVRSGGWRGAAVAPQLWSSGRLSLACIPSRCNYPRRRRPACR